METDLVEGSVHPAALSVDRDAYQIEVLRREGADHPPIVLVVVGLEHALVYTAARKPRASARSRQRAKAAPGPA